MIEICEQYAIKITIGKKTYTESLTVLSGETIKAVKRILEVAQELAIHAIRKSPFKTKEDVDLYRECAKDIVELCKTPVSRTTDLNRDLDEASAGFEKDIILESISKKNLVVTVKVVKKLRHRTAFHHQAVGGGFIESNCSGVESKKNKKPRLLSKMVMWLTK